MNENNSLLLPAYILKTLNFLFTNCLQIFSRTLAADFHAMFTALLCSFLYYFALETIHRAWLTLT